MEDYAQLWQPRVSLKPLNVSPWYLEGAQLKLSCYRNLSQ